MEIPLHPLIEGYNEIIYHSYSSDNYPIALSQQYSLDGIVWWFSSAGNFLSGSTMFNSILGDIITGATTKSEVLGSQVRLVVTYSNILPGTCLTVKAYLKP